MKKIYAQPSFIIGIVITLFVAVFGNTTRLQAQCPDTLIVPRGMTICEGTSITFTVNPDLPVTEGNYIWTTGDTAFTITVTPTQSMYVGLMIDKGGTICVDSVFISVIEKPDSITAASTIICNPFTINLKAMLGTTHQWYRYNFPISGATGQIFTATLGGNYYCETSNACGTFNSNTIQLTKYYPPTLNISLSGSSVICSGDSVAINSITNAALPTYAWTRNNLSIAGATNPTLQAKLAGNYKLIVTDNTTTCSRTSSGIKVSYFTLTATLTAAPCNTGSVTFTVTTNSTQPDIKWYKNGVLIAGATWPTYTTTTKGYYKALVTDLGKGCVKFTSSIQITSMCRMGEFMNSEDIVAYPNPTKDNLTIDVSDELEPFGINLYNMLGTKLKSVQFSNTFEMNEFPAGIYLLEIFDQDTKLLKRLRIQKAD